MTPAPNRSSNTSSPGRAVLGAVPTQKTIIAERFFDESGGMQLVIHAPFGGRINKAWGLALRKRFCRSFNFELQAAATETASIFRWRTTQLSVGGRFPFPASGIRAAVLEQAVLASPDFRRTLALGRRHARWPCCALRAEECRRRFSACAPTICWRPYSPTPLRCPENIDGDIEIPDHPLVRETMKDALTEAIDVEGLKAVLRANRQGGIECLAVDTPIPSHSRMRF